MGDNMISKISMGKSPNNGEKISSPPTEKKWEKCHKFHGENHRGFP
jgi:hypothetical protein